MEELVLVKGSLTFEHVIDRPRQLVSQEGQGLPLVMVVRQAGHVFLPSGIVAQEPHGGLEKGLLEMSVPNFLA
jgi:hypothetical protein